MSRLDSDIGRLAGSVGLLIDRSASRQEAFGTAWLIGEDQVATCAHLMVLFADYLPAVKVRFPAVDEDREVVEAVFHPRFNRELATELAQTSLIMPVSALSLADNNVVILKLSRHLTPLDPGSVPAIASTVPLPASSRAKGLAGAVDDIGLALLIQTVANTHKQGVVNITDERNRPRAKLFFRNGKLLYAKYGALDGEAAIYQMFIRKVTGMFDLVERPKPDWPVAASITRPTEGVLLEAHRRMDEIPRLLDELGGEGAIFMCSGDFVSTEALPKDVRQHARSISAFLDGGTTIDQLSELVRLDDYSIYAALAEMLKEKQVIALHSPMDRRSKTMHPLALAPDEPLAAWTELTSLTVHPVYGYPHKRKGNFLGHLRPNDSNHLLHNILLPYLAAGSPVFKGQQVVGMHCGMLPLDPRIYPMSGQLNQMIASAAIRECLAAAEKSWKRVRRKTGSVERVA
ncbi:MAG TPA: DUF4388 domain-containing protein, partial [Candidatus Obscuribacterales bacterium]